MAIVINEDFRVVLCDGSPGDDANGLDCFCGPGICECGCCNYMVQLKSFQAQYKHYFTPYADGWTGQPASHFGVFQWFFDDDVWNWRCPDGCTDDPCDEKCPDPPCDGGGGGYGPPPCPPGEDCSLGEGIFDGEGGWGRPAGGWGEGWPPGSPQAFGASTWLKLDGSFTCTEKSGIARYDFIFTMDLICVPGTSEPAVNPCGDQQGANCFPQNCPTCPGSGNCGQLRWHYVAFATAKGECPNGLTWQPAADICTVQTKILTQGWCVTHPVAEDLFSIVSCIDEIPP
ncbi:MAG: hypothetical protein QQN63_00580 [Nitrosopumilus sp.]